MTSEVPRRRRAPVTAIMLAMILALAAPSLAFSAFLLLQSDGLNRVARTLQAERGVDSIGDALDRDLQNMVTTLSVFAASGWIETANYARLHARAIDVLRESDTHLVAVADDLRPIMNTRVPWGTPLEPLSNPDPVMRALATGAPTVSGVFVGRIANEPVYNVVLPIISGEFETGALILSRSTRSLASIFAESLPPTGWTYAIIDQYGELVAGDAPRVGSPALLADLCQADGSSLNEVKVGDIGFSAAAETLETWGWRACVWTSSDQVEATILQRWRIFAIMVLVTVSLTILGAALLGRTLAGSIRRAANVGRALDAGVDVPEQHSFIREVDDVLGTLTRAARARLQHEEQVKLLARETAHRARNQIAISTALVRLSARSATSVTDLRDDITGRLQALARSIDAMSTTASGAVQLGALVKSQLVPFATNDPRRLTVAGPDVEASPSIAQALGLVLHELGTNAAKYGAWSAPGGHVGVVWSVEGGELVMMWTETGGPPARPPSTTGFGTSLIELMVERNLEGSVTREFKETGLVATIRAPLPA